jgi:hypothetical protein
MGSEEGHDLAAEVMPDVALELDADQAVLEGIMDDLGLKKHRKGKRKGSHDLVALEHLELEIAGKLLLWKALKQAEELEPHLRSVDFDQLIARATKQFDDVERERMRKAAQLFAPPVTVQYG